VFIKLKDNKIVSGFSQTQQYIIVLYLDDNMFRSLDVLLSFNAKLEDLPFLTVHV
jgi:hypothetical protein